MVHVSGAGHVGSTISFPNRADSIAGWFIQNIQDYTKMCPNGLAILDDKVKRRFPADDTWVAWDHPRAFEWESTVAELVQEIVQRHAEGIEFREYNVSPGELWRTASVSLTLSRLDLISTWTCGMKGSTRRSGSTGRQVSSTAETDTTAGE
jgi:hypothetical protein